MSHPSNGAFRTCRRMTCGAILRWKSKGICDCSCIPWGPQFSAGSVSAHEGHDHSMMSTAPAPSSSLSYLNPLEAVLVTPSLSYLQYAILISGLEGELIRYLDACACPYHWRYRIYSLRLWALCSSLKGNACNIDPLSLTWGHKSLQSCEFLSDSCCMVCL